jgi:hypothetical protein
MKRFVEGADRGQSTLFPECLEDWICEENPVRAIDVFVDETDLSELMLAVSCVPKTSFLAAMVASPLSTVEEGSENP